MDLLGGLRSVTTLAIPEPTALVQSPDALCSQVEAWADTVDSVDQLNDAKARMQAIDTYLARTSTTGRQRVAATLRRLEVRIGQLLGPPPGPGTRTDKEPASANAGLHRNQANDFRKMAEHADEVEDVIASSTDDDPSSRRKVMSAIGNGIPAKETPPEREELFKALRAIGDMERALKPIDPLRAASGADPLKRAEISRRAKRLAAWLTKFQQAMDKES